MHSRGLFCISLFQLFDENEFTLALLSPISVCKTLQINQFVVIIRLWVLPKFFIFFLALSSLLSCARNKNKYTISYKSN